MYNPERVLTIDGPLTLEKSLEVEKQINELSKLKAPISIVFRSSLGENYEGFKAIISALNSSGCEILTYALNYVHGLSAVLFLQGAQRHISVSAHLIFMNPPDASADMTEFILSELTEKTNLQRKDLIKYMDNHHIFDSNESLQIGAATEPFNLSPETD
jgi:ATP-dependent protease ClpP protease subunit